MTAMGQSTDTGGPEGLHVAVIGAGVAGITAAYLLGQRHRVTLFEKQARLGGHTNTIVIEHGPDAGAAVDTGFIVLNNRTYPGLHRMLSEWGVGVRSSDMSFSYYSEPTGFHYAGTSPNGLFAQRKNLLRPGFWRFLAEIPRFGMNGLQDLRRGAAAGLPLDEYLERRGYSERLRDDYILPMGAAIWSTPPARMREYPAQVFLRFFANHGLLTIIRAPQWQSVVGGSHSYIEAFRRMFSGDVVTRASITGVRRTDGGIVLHHRDRGDTSFDHVVMATHADEALALLVDASREERDLLGVWRYQLNRTVLHTDTRLLPPNRRAWASWNYRRETSRGEDQPISVTYHMNRLQGLKTSAEYCVTLNTSHAIDPALAIATFDYMHPTYTFESIASQTRLKALNGTGRTWFCGSYFGHGFHEDAVQSALSVVKQFDKMEPSGTPTGQRTQ
jgi:predicted NAD/FAD-binding protein